jgi:hypothetical protein
MSKYELLQRSGIFFVLSLAYQLEMSEEFFQLQRSIHYRADERIYLTKIKIVKHNPFIKILP